MNQKWGSCGDPGDLPAAEQPVLLRRALEKLETLGYDLDGLAKDVHLDPERVQEILGLAAKPAQGCPVSSIWVGSHGRSSSMPVFTFVPSGL